MSTWKERTTSYRRDPTRVFMEATFIQSCGHLNHDSMKRIRRAVLDALAKAATQEGIASTWAMKMKSKTPKDFDAILAHRSMALAEPPSADAVDPHASSTGKLSTRDESNV